MDPSEHTVKYEAKEKKVEEKAAIVAPEVVSISEEAAVSPVAPMAVPPPPPAAMPPPPPMSVPPPIEKPSSSSSIGSKLFSGKNLEMAQKKELVDVLFLCDCTGSMSSFIGAAKATVKKMTKDIQDKYNTSSIRIGFIGYRDHCDNPVYEKMQMTDDNEEIYKFVDHLTATGGGDTPEAIADALKAAVEEIEWRGSSLKLVILISDAPPHGKEYTSGDDTYPDGCPCKTDCKEMMKKLNDMDTQIMILTFGALLAKMVEVFKTCHKDIEVIALDDHSDMTAAEKEEVTKYRCEFGESREAVEARREESSDYAAADKMIAKTSATVAYKMKKKFG